MVARFCAGALAQAPTTPDRIALDSKTSAAMLFSRTLDSTAEATAYAGAAAFAVGRAYVSSVTDAATLAAATTDAARLQTLANAAGLGVVSSYDAATGVLTINGKNLPYLAGAPSTPVLVTVNALPVTSFSGSTATGTGTASASISGGGNRCQFDLANTGLVNAGQSFPGTGLSFPHGWLKLRLTDCDVGSTVRVTIHWPVAVSSNYVKYGRTPGSPSTNIFYTPSNLAVNGNVVSFDVTDGALGDDDLTANGSIVDPSGPLAQADIAVPVPTLHHSALLALALLMLAAAVICSRRT